LPSAVTEDLHAVAVQRLYRCYNISRDISPGAGDKGAVGGGPKRILRARASRDVHLPPSAPRWKR
jgi:hypothetical protein